MRTQLNKYYFLLLLGLLAACSDNFLDIEPKGLTPQENFYKTDKDAFQGVVAIHDIYQSLYAKDWESMWLLKTLPSEEINCGGGNAGDQPNYQDLAKFKHTASNKVIETCFKWLYQAIFRANMVIEKVDPDTDAKKWAIAEAKALRANSYLELVTLWGEVPLNLTILEKNEYSQPSATKEAIYTQIEKDLNEAIIDLPLRSEISSDPAFGNDYLFRVNKGTAQAILGKALLYQKKYNAASIELAKVISSGEFELASNYSQILRSSTEFTKQSLLEISYTTNEGHSWANNTFVWGNGRLQENNIHWQLCGPRGDGYFDAGSTGLVNGWGFAYPTRDFLNSYAEEDSVRRKATFLTEVELIAQGGDIWFLDSVKDEKTKAFIRVDTLYPYDYEGSIRLKYGTWKDETDASVQAELNYGTNVRLIRYADVLLMAAEAYNKDGKDGMAQTELNKVRGNVGLDPVSLTGTQLFDAIVYERKTELAFEGHRYYDLIRWGLAPSILGSRGFQAKHVVFPIPQVEIDANTLLEQTNIWK